MNKLDRERADFGSTLDQLVSSFGNQVAPFELPIGAEHEFKGIADLLHEKADLYLGAERGGVGVARRDPSDGRPGP